MQTESVDEVKTLRVWAWTGRAAEDVVKGRQPLSVSVVYYVLLPPFMLSSLEFFASGQSGSKVLTGRLQ